LQEREKAIRPGGEEGRREEGSGGRRDEVGGEGKVRERGKEKAEGNDQFSRPKEMRWRITEGKGKRRKSHAPESG
jgi:hypothetical protein